MEEIITAVEPGKTRSSVLWQYPRNPASSLSGDTSDPVIAIASPVHQGQFSAPGIRLGVILKSWKKTIHKPASEITDSAPAANVHVTCAAGTGRERSKWRRVGVADRNRHITHKAASMTGVAHGIRVVVFRLAMSSAPQVYWATARIANAIAADRRTVKNRFMCFLLARLVCSGNPENPVGRKVV